MTKTHEHDTSSGAHFISKTLNSCALFWMTFPLTFIFYSAVVMNLQPEDILKILLRPFYWIISMIALWAGYGLLKIKWYGWYLFIVSNIFVLYETILVLTDYSKSSNRMVIFLGTLLFQLILLLVVAKQVRVPYFFPKIRWWESDPRYKLSVPVKVFKKDGSDLEGEIMDISLGGCFIKTHAYFSQDEDIKLEYSLFDKTIKCSGVAVWRTESKVTHPKGIGVKFSPLEKETVLVLKKAQQRLTQLNRTYQQMTVERNWEEYLRREKRFQGNAANEPKNDEEQ